MGVGAEVLVWRYEFRGGVSGVYGVVGAVLVTGWIVQDLVVLALTRAMYSANANMCNEKFTTG